jgi:UDP-hydrolysing UDP-N-acetyl-D-glucosamine 2-epimerase
MKNKKIKLCVVVLSRANYGRIKTLLSAAKKHPDIKLQIVVGASAVLERYGNNIKHMRKDGFFSNETVYSVVEGDNPVTQCKTTGLSIIALSTAFERLKPDFVLTVADRYETISTAIAATYSNIPLIHIQGGEVSGNIDDRVRNAITKLADIHFPCTELSRQRIIKMGEPEEYVFNFGCPAIDIALQSDKSLSSSSMKADCVAGREADWTKPYVLISQHSVTTSYGDGVFQITQTLYAVKALKDHQKIVLWPNSDAGSGSITEGIRKFTSNRNDKNEKIYFYNNFSPEDYIRLLYNADCLIGNSSSFIREGCALGLPAVLIGDRQVGREQGKNVIPVTYSSEAILDAALKQIKHGKYEPSNLFGKGDAGEKIISQITRLQVQKVKRMTY